MKQYVKYESNSGNALWFILLAVALLGALTAAITRSSDTVEQSGDIERHRIDASNLMRHSASVEAAVQNMQMRSIGENFISFENDIITGSNLANPNCGNLDCLVYHGAGGGINYRALPGGIFDNTHIAEDTFGEWEFSGNNNITGIGTAAPELIMFVRYLQRNLCRQINALLKIPNISGDVPIDSNSFNTTPFQGSFTAAGTIENMDGHKSGCFYDSSEENYVYYHVLITR